MPLQNRAFKTTFKPYRKLVILGQTIDDTVIKHISPLNAELDYPDLTTFNIGNVTITLFDPDGTYNPNNPDNFWTQHQHNQTGYKSAVEIHIGYVSVDVHTGDLDSQPESEKIFDGEIANIRVNLQPPEVIIEAVDASQNLRPAKLDNFGIPRRVILPEDPNTNTDTTYSGRYPFPQDVIPSDRSVSAITNIGRTEMTDVGTISTEGIASPLNYQVSNGAIETEGGPLWTPNIPLASYKDVYRYKRVDALVRNILEHYGITDSEIDILQQTTNRPHFASHGRPGWELENLDT